MGNLQFTVTYKRLGVNIIFRNFQEYCNKQLNYT